jgi:hypothetical protein
MQKQRFRHLAPLRHGRPSDLSATPGTTSTRGRQLQGAETVNPGLPDATGPVLRAALASTRLAVS